MNKMSAETMTGTAAAAPELEQAPARSLKRFIRPIVMFVVPAAAGDRRRLLLAVERRQRVDRQRPGEAGHRFGQPAGERPIVEASSATARR